MFEPIVSVPIVKSKLVHLEPDTKKIVNNNALSQFFGRLVSLTGNKSAFIKKVRSSALEALKQKIDNNQRHYDFAEMKLNSMIKSGKKIDAEVVNQIYTTTKPKPLTKQKLAFLKAKKSSLLELIKQAGHQKELSEERAAGAKRKDKKIALRNAKSFAKVISKASKEISEINNKLDTSNLRQIVEDGI